MTTSFNDSICYIINLCFNLRNSFPLINIHTIMEYETEKNGQYINNVIMKFSYTLKTEPKPPCPSLLVGEKLSVAATMQLRLKVDKFGCLLMSSSPFPSKEHLAPIKLNDWLCNFLITVLKHIDKHCWL